MKVLHISRGFRPFIINGLLEYAEDLMDIQVAQGYKVACFFYGRYYPLLRRPWLRKWWKKDIIMYEIINSPIFRGQGTMYPEADINEEYSEKFFLKVLSEFQPHIIHIQDLFSLPSSLINIVKLKDIPVLMTLHDYFLLCPTSNLFDYNHSRCLNQYVGDKCVLCCAQAPRNTNHLIISTLIFEVKKRWLLKTILNNIKRARKIKKQIWRCLPNKVLNQERNSSFEKIEKLAEVFQTRRNINVERLNKIDLLVAQSSKLAEIYQTLGVQSNKVMTVNSTVKHIDYIKPKSITSIVGSINFVTLNGCASVHKGSHLILGAVRKLNEIGLNSQFKLLVMGHLSEEIKDEILQFNNVVYKGFYNVTDLDSLLEEMHVGIVPSIWEEAYGYVGIELLAKGIPVIGNSLGGIVDYTVDNVTGWLNRANTADGLAQIMTNIISNPKQILELNRSIISNYHQIIKSMDGHFKEMDNIYKNLIQTKQK